VSKKGVLFHSKKCDFFRPKLGSKRGPKMASKSSAFSSGLEAQRDLEKVSKVEMTIFTKNVQIVSFF